MTPPWVQAGISQEEYRLIVEHLDREPSSLELALFGVMWSEHCSYKHSKALLGRLPRQGPEVLQGPGENAGVVRIAPGWGAAFKVESHNHPSAVEPYQGAATGVGGILRDIFAMGARPVAVLDGLAFGPLDSPRTQSLFAGVVEGISGYGNAIGVPTVGGTTSFHSGFAENPLVNAMAVGIVSESHLQKSRGDVGASVYYAGARTGRDGIGGAAFASLELGESSQESRPAVQVGDPFYGKLILEATLEASSRGLLQGAQDMGAAGLTSSLVELAEKSSCGIEVFLDRVPLREAGMSPAEILLSESQERMVLVPKPEGVADLEAIFTRLGLELAPVAHLIADPVFKVLHKGEVLAEIPIEVLAGAPAYLGQGQEDPLRLRRREADTHLDLEWQDLQRKSLEFLGSPYGSSREPIYRRYDHQVGTRTQAVPGQAAASVIWVREAGISLALALSGLPLYGELDPFLAAAHALAQASRNVSLVGARPLAFTNGINLGNPENPQGYFELEGTVAGLAEAARELNLPVISGNVSLYNEGPWGRVPATVYVGVLGTLAPQNWVGELLSQDLELYLIGDVVGSLNGSHFQRFAQGWGSGSLPAIDYAQEKALQGAAQKLAALGILKASRGVERGGIFSALVAMTAKVGAVVELPFGAPILPFWFGESAGRAILAFTPEEAPMALEVLDHHQLSYLRLGHSLGSGITLRQGEQAINWSVESLEAASGQGIGELI